MYKRPITLNDSSGSMHQMRATFVTKLYFPLKAEVQYFSRKSCMCNQVQAEPLSSDQTQINRSWTSANWDASKRTLIRKVVVMQNKLSSFSVETGINPRQI